MISTKEFCDEQPTTTHREEGSPRWRRQEGQGEAMKAPKEMTLASLQVLVMPNGEVLCLGFSIGWVKQLGKMLTPIEGGK